ncbi:Hypothetical protein Tcol_1026 [Trichococcus collinsii]|uniref:Uncharacterized protein n=1 Tax=Trichococcus collinsii TaxID=157076 RepID=A0AB38A0N6_9LACT|nr:Hypothetical protein Tcol_1026 [Trichococcus collinsii]SEA52438.1 hypothetical protein SAMN04488525_103333 [Trichococcus collinsii]
MDTASYHRAPVSGLSPEQGAAQAAQLRPPNPNPDPNPTHIRLTYNCIYQLSVTL